MAENKPGFAAVVLIVAGQFSGLYLFLETLRAGIQVRGLHCGKRPFLPTGFVVHYAILENIVALW